MLNGASFFHAARNNPDRQIERVGRDTAKVSVSDEYALLCLVLPDRSHLTGAAGQSNEAHKIQDVNVQDG
jgi:hypothetical protein